MMINRIVARLLNGMGTVAAADDAAAFFAANPCPEARMLVEQGIEGVRARAACISREAPAIAEYFATWAPTA